ncbi:MULTISPECIES: hypothetical protein [Bacteria]|uniref:Uncharacterized protein n=3 Tax=Gammaproteobacteria TaxID=1236 RepID=A0A0U3TIT7_PRORE|nr:MULTISPECIES: hypothetical protein [Gammaproteobacteria]ALV81727.1 hypothetical protein AOY08_100007 [Providencia rettgeri]ELR5224363.1 hypothetical protein [Providencia rettgeri]MDG4698925.1 hypothetical protein [Providencia sp. CRE-3FA-0001]MDX7324554.1 hypothetical protein [Providencia rettgeri]OBY34055.1 hypothetical protein PR729_06205 [Providencia rettgeri]
MDKNESIISSLGYIQDIIKRMASNSFFIKGWALSISAVIIALIPKLDEIESYSPNSIPIVITLSIIILFMFSLLDTYYLQQERIFRNEYNRKVESIDNEDIKNSLTIISLKKVKTSYLSVYFTISIIPYYFIMISSLIIGSYLI